MKLEGKHIAIVVYGVVDERSKKSARALAGAGARVTILSLTNTRASHEGEPFSVHYLSPGLPAGSTIPWRPLRVAVNLTRRFFNRSAERKAGVFGKHNAINTLRELRPDVIHAINPDTLSAVAEAAAELGVPYVYEAYEFWPDHALSNEVKHSTELREEILTIERHNIADAAAVITVSPYLAQEYRAAYNLDEEPATIFNAPPFITGQPLPVHEPLCVLFFGNLQPERNIALLLDAAAQLPSIRVTFQGNGIMSGEILEFARAHNAEDRIIIKKPVSYSDIATSASEHDVGIICHRAYDRQMEGALPNKFFEYLSGGLAVVATDTIAFREFPNFEEFGMLIDVEQEGSLVAALDELSRNPERVTAMKAAAFQAAQLYCGDAQAQKLVALYSEIEEATQ